ncbi:MAG: NAD(P)H-dependent glycerol-3-phosphate dehydrogenase [Kurthia gibsonii]|uniref:Glycerol-3-phosphate dehydrogenase [NAD(P)+] n=3 Tax=Kurthia gibsonii TaxID=33946 RepID=A0ABU9LHU4_9BACL|nr:MULTISPECIES: NAD(P)H-dependent glycerol-3-phosphate dehydrogenase [Kurthia]MCA9724221.1 NAD(P)H-dependent glycerol-3-phosphate dehydrogenase [Kurthia sp.]AMA62261.1 ketopantoate reductase PanE/ApbA family protein [Kurthia sp. 11kri321]MEB6111571.1 NAD(P)H-dependent glycerol-3-phosphate dehydrogenase [Kurthia gibsonii]MEB7771919.1 NAD(P)H-dependent glycerol-3-phosphate dehydrogenase [Kurthia gibsonii]WIL39541.1 NAD(P)H-dependent glycerol-3-phosphate dehydrogenase [Kurthia sp. YJT4]
MSKVTVFGAGSWGTALATVLAENGHDTLLWSHREDQAQEIQQQHTNEKYLPGTVLPQNLCATSDVASAVEHAEVIVMAVPTKGIRETCQKIMKTLNRQIIFVHVSKGIEPDSLIRISEIMKEELAEEVVKDIVVLSGPSHAEEVVKKHPTTVASSCENLESAVVVQDLFMNHYFRVYTNEDVVGVELGGALKNVIALAAGVSDGIGFGDNAKAALITRGLAEISRLGIKMGANPMTFMGLAGMGDLIVTCTSVHSRNWRAGNLLGKGLKLEEVLEQMGMVVEGVRTTKAAHQLADKYEVSMPIVQALYAVLFEDQSAKEMVEKLMLRMKKSEMDGQY